MITNAPNRSSMTSPDGSLDPHRLFYMPLDPSCMVQAQPTCKTGVLILDQSHVLFHHSLHPTNQARIATSFRIRQSQSRHWTDIGEGRAHKRVRQARSCEAIEGLRRIAIYRWVSASNQGSRWMCHNISVKSLCPMGKPNAVGPSRLARPSITGI